MLILDSRLPPLLLVLWLRCIWLCQFVNVHIHVSLCILFPTPVCLAGVFGFFGACINKGLLYILAD